MTFRTFLFHPYLLLLLYSTLIFVSTGRGKIQSNQTTLNTVVTAIKSINRGSGNNQGNVVIQLTPAFYNYSSSYIIVDYSPSNTAGGIPKNTKPYTIRGLGTTGTSPSLKVGMWLANDNITLENVKFVIGSTNKGTSQNNGNVPKYLWAWEHDGTVYYSVDYCAAVLIGRNIGTDRSGLSPRALGYEFDETPANALQNVTVRNCDISIKGSVDYTAGIWVLGRIITIEGNTVTATGNGRSPVQALGFMRWDSGIRVTGNTLKAVYGTPPDASVDLGKTPSGPANYGNWPVNAPGSAFFINGMFEVSFPYTGSVISGNTLSYGSSHTDYGFSFYINGAVPATPTRAGITEMREDDFANGDTKWITDTANTSQIYRLVRELFGNIGNGFGLVSLVLQVGDGNTYMPKVWNDYAHEIYTIKSGQPIRISYWGYTRAADGLTYNSGPAPNEVSGSITLPKTPSSASNDYIKKWAE